METMEILPPVPEPLATRLASPLTSQQGFTWDRKKWATVAHDLPAAGAILNDLPDSVDREATREIVQANLVPGRVLGAFIAVYLWGGPGGYGPHRARGVLTGVRTRGNIDAPVDGSVEDRLLAGADRVRGAGAAEAFRLMNNEGRVKNLGGAFFTKWLSFASMVDSTDGDEVAPILDAQVCRWIAANTSGDMQVRLSPSSTQSYCRYLDLLDAWGAPFGRSRAQVELAIFESTGSRAAGGS